MQRRGRRRWRPPLLAWLLLLQLFARAAGVEEDEEEDGEDDAEPPPTPPPAPPPPPPAVFVGCSRSRPCANNGTCELNTGACACLLGYGGPLCSEPLYPACRKTTAVSPLGFPPAMRCAIYGARSCDCLLQCADRPMMDRVSSNLNCFNRSGLPPAEQLSVFPAEDDASAVYFESWHPSFDYSRNRVNASAMQSRWQSGEWLAPPALCPGGCSGEGECVRSSPTDRVGFCICYPGFRGEACDAYVGNTHCVNECSGRRVRAAATQRVASVRLTSAAAAGRRRGTCIRAVCSCQMGFFGIDCSIDLRETAALPGGGGPIVQGDPPRGWFHDSVFGPEPRRPGTAAAALALERSRVNLTAPRVYVYELPPWLGLAHDVDRAGPYGGPAEPDGIYNAPKEFLSRLLRDPVLRTRDPYEANLFLAPCSEYAFSSNGAPPHPQVKRVLKYLRANYAPFLERFGGADHMFWAPGDPGACPIPDELASLLWVTHFGLTNYSVLRPDAAKPGEVCHYAERGIVVPPLGGTLDIWARRAYVPPPAGAAPRPRDVTLFFAGTMGFEQPLYSMGVRQEVYRRYANRSGFEIHADQVSAAEYMRRSRFCLCPTGSGWGVRLVQAVANGCVPVIVQDQVHQPGDDVLNYASFSLRLRRADIPILDRVLEAITPAQLAAMQAALKRVHRFFIWEEIPEAPGAASPLGPVRAYDLVARQLKRKLFQIQSRLT